MKICFSSYADLTEPTVLNFFNLGKELSRIGYEITLLLPKVGEKLLSNETNLIHIERLKVLLRPGLGKIASQTAIQSFHLASRKFDIVHAVKPLVQSVIPTLIHSKLNGSLKLVHMDDYEAYSAILTEYNPIFAGFIRWYEINSLKSFDAATCVSPFLRELAGKIIPKERTFLVNNGFDPREFDPNLGENVKKEFRISGHLLVHLGGLRKNTDVDFVIRAMPLVLKEVKDVKLMIVGDGPLKNDLIHLSKKLGLGRDIIFTGFQPHNRIPKFLACADSLLLPMRKNPFNEARFPNRIAEYMGIGKPIVTNEVGVIKEKMKDGLTARIVEPNNLEAYARAIVELIEDEKLARKLGKNARNYALKNLTWERIAKHFDEIYRNLSLKT